MNATRISARIAQAGALRHTPAGLPAVDLQLEHESSVEEGGSQRQVKVSLKAVAIGAVAERVVRQDVGSLWSFSGFLASPRGGRHPVLHIQDFQHI